jgi:hypothetical protein
MNPSADISSVVELVAALAQALRKPCGDAGAVLRRCVEAVETQLETMGQRDAPVVELEYLVARLALSESGAQRSVMREIRRVIGRIDSSR